MATNGQATTRVCIIEGCDNALTERSRVPVCVNCRHVFWYWKRPEKGVQAVIERGRTLDKWRHRMIYLGAQDRRFARAKNTFVGQATVAPPKAKETRA